MRTVAFYLPQFHQIPENDEWWGVGFTEWTNVRRADPMFDGHSHPRRPALLGEYDLLDDHVHRAQSELAQTHGIDAFCMYFYWFNGRRLLERPTEMWRSDPTLLPYCLSWANESWTRRWDGGSRKVLMGQDYEEGFTAALFADLLPHFSAPHYLRQDGKPILLVHRSDLIPDAKAFSARVHQLAQEHGLPGIHLVASETTPGLRPGPLGFDAVAEFPPVGANTLRTAQLRPVRSLDKRFRGRLQSYPRLADRYTKRRRPRFVRYHGVAPSWDNTARRQFQATVYVGASPQRYAAWLDASRRAETSQRGTGGLVFVNAWNEWAEGAYLEPDTENATLYLEASLAKAVLPVERDNVPSTRVWSLVQVRSLLLITAGSVLALSKRLRNRLA